jgi:hypothetical protein
MKKILVFAFLIPLSVTTLFCQEPATSQPQGKPLALIFSNFHRNFVNGQSFPAFEITRAYLGYEYTFSSEWYGYIVMDVGDPEAGNHQFAAFLKNAFLRYRHNRLSFFFGMIPTTQFKVSENIWGYRYIEESYQDLYNFNSSADIGFTIDYRFADFISADFSVFNGEGYKRVQRDEFLRPSAGITVNPVRELTARLYADYIGGEIKQKSLAAFMAYSGYIFTAGAEYNYQQNTGMIDGRNRFGPSIFATFIPIPNIKIFGRYDQLNSNTLEGENDPWQINRDGQLIIAGVEYSPLRGVKFAPNYRMWIPESGSLPTVNSIYLNCEVRF